MRKSSAANRSKLLLEVRARLPQGMAIDDESELQMKQASPIGATGDNDHGF